eukprot:COSAG01_NODE_2064_length_8507_cov_312.247740_8_plen_121_part_00
MTGTVSPLIATVCVGSAGGGTGTASVGVDPFNCASSANAASSRASASSRALFSCTSCSCNDPVLGICIDVPSGSVTLVVVAILAPGGRRVGCRRAWQVRDRVANDRLRRRRGSPQLSHRR